MDHARTAATDDDLPLVRSLYQQVVDAVGGAIVDGDLAVDDPLLADDLCAHYDVSRSVVREAVRTLGSMGLVRSRRHSGTRVRAMEHWDLLNPQVVRWRAHGRDHVVQALQLLELRLGVEPAAAGLAARRMGDDMAAELVDCTERMELAYGAGDVVGFFELDTAFHRRLLEGTGNALVSQLAETIDATLSARSDDERAGFHTVSGESVRQHRRVAEAVAARDVAVAERAARELVESLIADFEAQERWPAPAPRPARRPG